MNEYEEALKMAWEIGGLCDCEGCNKQLQRRADAILEARALEAERAERLANDAITALGLIGAATGGVEGVRNRLVGRAAYLRGLKKDA